jgi:hypothetical protein
MHTAPSLSCTRGASAQSLLHSVLTGYDALQFERVGEEIAQMLARVWRQARRRRSSFVLSEDETALRYRYDEGR